MNPSERLCRPPPLSGEADSHQIFLTRIPVFAIIIVQTAAVLYRRKNRKEEQTYDIQRIIPALYGRLRRADIRRVYAEKRQKSTVFGPAYKGIPLAAAAAVALADKYQKDVNFCFDRKEVKDHGEGGMFVGKKLTDGEKVVIIEDVMTSGKAMAEVYPKLKGAADVDITGMVITVDRMERALEGEKSAVQSVYEKYGVPVYSIVNMEDIIQGIRDEVIPGKEHLDAMLAYREQYGVKA